MKAEELKTKTEDELDALLLDQRKAQLNLRFQKSNGVLERASDFRKARRTIARIKTFINAHKAGKTITSKAETKKAAAKKAPAKKPAAKKETKKA
jgi:large subunit ribosomal protein L29